MWSVAGGNCQGLLGRQVQGWAGHLNHQGSDGLAEACNKAMSLLASFPAVKILKVTPTNHHPSPTNARQAFYVFVTRANPNEGLPKLGGKLRVLSLQHFSTVSTFWCWYWACYHMNMLSTLGLTRRDLKLNRGKSRLFKIEMIYLVCRSWDFPGDAVLPWGWGVWGWSKPSQFFCIQRT